MDKRELRKNIVKLRDQLSLAEIRDKSFRIANNLYSLPEFRAAHQVMFFVSFGSEVDTRDMVEVSIKADKVALVPKAKPAKRELIPSEIRSWENDLEPGTYDILEPKEKFLRPRDPEGINLLIVPGVAFDKKGNRLGYGGGYYDRFFPQLMPGTPLVALAFELQIVPEVPVDEWDRPVDKIITEERIIDCSNL